MNTLIKPGLFLSFILMMVSACANASGGIALGKIYLYKAFQCNVTAGTFTQGEEQHYLQQLR